MGLFGRIKLIMLAVALLTGGTVAYLGKDITKAGVDDYEILGINSLDSSGFNVDMTLNVTNPSKLNLKVDTIRYTATLQDSGQVVAQGFIKGLSLPKGEITTIDVSPRINWLPTADLVAKYATQDEVWMDIELDITLYKILPETSITVSVDIKEAFSGRGSGLGNGGVLDDDLFNETLAPKMDTTPESGGSGGSGNSQPSEEDSGPLFEVTF